MEGAAKQLRETLRSCDWGAWDERAIWALEDSVPKFSLEGGRVVLWRRMSIEIPELLGFEPAEIRARWLTQADATSAAQLRDEPPCLEDWECVGPGRYEGVLHNLPSLRDGSLRATIEHDAASGAADEAASACSAEGIDGQRRYVRTSSGALFELGVARPLDKDATADATPVVHAASLARALVGSAEDADAANTAKAALSAMRPAILAAAALMGAAYAALELFGHHHINVSVFIV